MARILALFLALLSVLLPSLSFAAYNVSYDSRSLIIDGRRQLLISAAIHYPRSVPAVSLSLSLLLLILDIHLLTYECVQMWPGLVQLAKEGGINTIETYVFWNGHELSPNNVGLCFTCISLFCLFLLDK